MNISQIRGIAFASLIVAAFGIVGMASAAETRSEEKLPPGRKLVRIEARPATISLKTPFDYSQLLLTGYLDSGEAVDVTRMAQVQPPAALLKISPTGVVRPLADGSGSLQFSLAGQSVSIPITITGQKEKYSVSYVRDVMPAMSKMGCNAGTCHGAQSGKNGFKLSLRGYDPLFDHRALTDDHSGRRFNRSAPDTSLMLLKPSGAAPHVGGVVTQPGEPYYELLRAWIADGVKLDLSSPRVTSIDIFPKSPMIPLIGMSQQMAVVATYSDGSMRDVSAEAFIESSNTEAAKVDKSGLVKAERRGEATMLARYEGAYTATTLVVMGDRSGFAWKDVPEFNHIDVLVDEKLKQMKILPSELCTDAEFIRRIYLDLTGLPPQPDEVREFLNNPRPTQIKRAALVDRLIGSPAFIEHWTNKWADLLQVNRKFLGEKGATALREWIKQAVVSNMPYDKFVNSILTASGSTLENPPAAYHKILRDPGSEMENTTQLFLAIRFNCNKCHDHPFERWTQDQYYQLAAYFAQVSRKEDPKFKGQKVGGSAVEGAVPLVEIIADTNSGDVTHERTGVVTPPVFPYKHKDLAPTTEARRQQLAHWITSKENSYFARSYVNRMWSYMLGVGLVEPIDDIRAGNPPSNPKLLDRLTNDFVASGFDVQQLIRTICQSRVYQQSLTTNKWNADDDLNYSHALARRLPAEVLYDTIHRATGSMTKLPGLPIGTRAAQLLDSSVEIPGGFLNLFGKPPRESACECERSGSMMLGPVLNLVNGPVMANAIRDPNNRIAKLVATENDDGKVVDELFLAVLNRLPSPKEREAGVQSLKGNQEEYVRLVKEYEKAVAAVKSYEEQLPAKQAQWEADYHKSTTWSVLDTASAVSSGGAVLTKLPDGSILASGKNAAPDTYTITVNTKMKGITALRLEVLTDESLPGKGPGRAPNGNFVLNEFRVTAHPEGTQEKPKKIVLQKPIADFSQDAFGIAAAIDNNPATGWAVSPRVGQPHVALFEVQNPYSNPNGITYTFTLEQKFTTADHNIGKFRLSATTVKPPITLGVLPEQIARIVSVDINKRTVKQKVELSRYYRSLDTELPRLQQFAADMGKPGDARLVGAQDLVWALMNNPAFLFNH